MSNKHSEGQITSYSGDQNKTQDQRTIISFKSTFQEIVRWFKKISKIKVITNSWVCMGLMNSSSVRMVKHDVLEECQQHFVIGNPKSQTC